MHVDILSATILECLLQKFIQSYNCTFAMVFKRPTSAGPSLAPQQDYHGPRSGKAQISFYY